MTMSYKEYYFATYCNT